MESSGISNGIEVKESLPWLKVIIIEDQGYPQVILLRALHKVFGNRIKDFVGGDVLLVNNYSDAARLLESGDLKNYNFVLLDNVLTADPIPEAERGEPLSVGIKGVDTSSFPVRDDPKNYSNYPQRSGYSLIPKFNEQGIIVVGTSSMSPAELRAKGLPEPDFVSSKLEVPGSETGSNLMAIAPALESTLKKDNSKRRI